MTEFLFKLGLSVVMVAVSGGALHWICTHQIDPIASVARLLQGAVEPGWVATRDPNKLYQGDQEFEYQRMRLIVRGVGTVIGQDIGMGPSGPPVSEAALADVGRAIGGGGG